MDAWYLAIPSSDIQIAQYISPFPHQGEGIGKKENLRIVDHLKNWALNHTRSNKSGMAYKMSKYKISKNTWSKSKWMKNHC